MDEILEKRNNPVGFRCQPHISADRFPDRLRLEIDHPIGCARLRWLGLGALALMRLHGEDLAPWIIGARNHPLLAVFTICLAAYSLPILVIIPANIIRAEIGLFEFLRKVARVFIGKRTLAVFGLSLLLELAAILSIAQTMRRRNPPQPHSTGFSYRSGR